MRANVLAAATITVVGALWAWDSWNSGDAVEAAECGSVGVGFALLTLALARPDAASRARASAAAAGLAVVAVGTAPWLWKAAQAGQFPLRWGLFALGAIIAALALAIGAISARVPARFGARVGFALIAVAGLDMLLPRVELTLWPITFASVVAGSVALAWEPPAFDR